MAKRTATENPTTGKAATSKHVEQCALVMDLINSLQFDDRLAGAHDLKKRLIEFGAFLGHAARRPALLAQPMYDLIERDVRSAGGRAGRGRPKKLAPLREASGSRAAMELVRVAWLEWQRKPANYPDFARFRDAMKARRLVGDDRTLAGWCARFVQSERVYVGWQRAHENGRLPAVLRDALQAKSVLQVTAA